MITFKVKFVCVRGDLIFNENDLVLTNLVPVGFCGSEESGRYRER